MKKSVLTLLAVLFIFTVQTAHAQDTLREGKITMAISFPDAGDKAEMMKSTMGSEYVIYFKNKNSRSEMKMVTGNMIQITNEENKESYSLMNMMGMKYAMKIPASQIDSINKANNQSRPKVKLKKDTKKILGYNCKHAIVTTTINGQEQESDYWYTTEITSTLSSLNIMGPEEKTTGIKGFPVETTMKMQDVTITMTLKSIDKIPVADSMFEVPADYPIKSMDEIKQEMMEKIKNQMGDIAPDMTSEMKGPFPEIEMNDVNGKPLKLSSLRGKYVLVDFWASWCVPCRAQSPGLVKAYNMYKDKGFTIYSVSLDKKKNEWVKAIETDKLIWENHVCDFNGWNSSICRELNIQGIPVNYLLDKDGNVIAMGLYDSNIEQILQEKIK